MRMGVITDRIIMLKFPGKYSGNWKEYIVGKILLHRYFRSLHYKAENGEWRMELYDVNKLCFIYIFVNMQELLVIRKIHPCLPSFKAEFTASVPLTRIRDIAHRNDIPHDLKVITFWYAVSIFRFLSFNGVNVVENVHISARNQAYDTEQASQVCWPWRLNCHCCNAWKNHQDPGTIQWRICWAVQNISSWTQGFLQCCKVCYLASNFS